MFYCVILKTRNISWLSGYCKFRSRLEPCLDSRFKAIFKNLPISEMPAVQFNNCENRRISFERKSNQEMNGKNTCACLVALHSQNCLRLFLLDLLGTSCVHFQTIELNESLTTICLTAIWIIVLLQ